MTLAPLRRRLLYLRASVLARAARAERERRDADAERWRATAARQAEQLREAAMHMERAENALRGAR